MADIDLTNKVARLAELADDLDRADSCRELFAVWDGFEEILGVDAIRAWPSIQQIADDVRWLVAQTEVFSAVISSRPRTPTGTRIIGAWHGLRDEMAGGAWKARQRSPDRALRRAD